MRPVIRKILSRVAAIAVATLLIFAGSAAASQSIIVVPVTPVAVAPGQPEVAQGSTAGIINALCEVKLNILGCGFWPTSVTINCDTNGDGVPELMIPLKSITAINGNLVRATLPVLSPQLPGTAFPLACCGGAASLTLTRRVSAGDDSIFGDYTQSATCPIELGERAPVIISVSPSGADCSRTQNLLIPGACFVRGDGTPNVNTVYAVEAGNPSNVVQASKFTILSPNLIDASFDFGTANAGRVFLFYLSGPNGTSRNLTALPAGVPAGCPLGNEQGVAVTLTCQGGAQPAPPQPAPPTTPSAIACSIERSSSGAFSLVLTSGGEGYRRDAIIEVNGEAAKKVKLKNRADAPDTFRKAVVKGKLCESFTGATIVLKQNGYSHRPFRCLATCDR